jgi:hypothetical protein
MANRIKSLKKILGWIIILYRVVKSIIDALDGNNPGKIELPSAKKPGDGPKKA